MEAPESTADGILIKKIKKACRKKKPKPGIEPGTTKA
jgi:hypothetical protein